MIGNGVEIFGSYKAMKPLDKGVVQYEHDGGEIPSPLLIPEEHLANVTGVLDLRVAKTELPTCPY